MITVYVWKPKGVISRDFGHAALQIDGNLGKYYISFYPGHKKTSLALRGQGRLIGNYTEDCDSHHMGRSADATISLSGLYEDDIWLTWLGIETDELRYDLFKINCSTVVYNLLKIGEAGIPSDVLASTQNRGSLIGSLTRINQALPITFLPSMAAPIRFVLGLFYPNSFAFDRISSGSKVVGDAVTLFIGNTLQRNGTKLPNDVLELANKLQNIRH